jgi:hypothetical protein
MRKPIIILLALIFLLTGCKENAATVTLDQLPSDYDLEDAKSDNCVVYEDSDITYGQTLWDDFITATDKGISATVRLAFYFTLGDPSSYTKECYEEIKDDYPVLYIQDLSFDGKKYVIESIEDGQLISKEFKYMKKYEGQPRSATAIFSDYTYYVLVNDNTVTWEDIWDGMISSKSSFGSVHNLVHKLVYSDYVFK